MNGASRSTACFKEVTCKVIHAKVVGCERINEKPKIHFVFEIELDNDCNISLNRKHYSKLAVSEI